MNDTIMYILLGLSVLLTAAVIILLVSVARLRENIKDNSKQSGLTAQYMQQSLQQEITDVRTDVRAFQSSLVQSYGNLQDSMQQSVTRSYSALYQTLDNKLQLSFDSINSYLQAMNKDLGEMKNVAGGIEDVRKVLSNVKTRGILGEIQLGAILQEILAPQQYELNVATVPGSAERVEFAVKLPGEERPVYLPIDSKFPGDAYAHLLDAYDTGDEDEVLATKKLLTAQFRKEARDISSKYIQVPYTTEFAIMFLPFEGLYAEAVNMGVIEMLLSEFSVVVAGPSTMAALLSSLQMGFKTLAIQENAEKVWSVLGNVKAEFEKFSDVLCDAQSRLSKVSEDLDKLVGARTKKIQKALSDVEKLEGFAPSDSSPEAFSEYED